MAEHLMTEEQAHAFSLYLKYGGERHDLIEREMHEAGYVGFKQNKLRDRGKGKNHRDGWVNKFGWDHALKKHLEGVATNQIASTSGEKLLIEVEFIREAIFEAIKFKGAANSKDLVWQHKKYVDSSVDILKQLNDARDNYGNFVFFLKHLVTSAVTISPALAKELCDAEDAIIEWAERKFIVEEEKPEDGE